VNGFTPPNLVHPIQNSHLPSPSFASRNSFSIINYCTPCSSGAQKTILKNPKRFFWNLATCCGKGGGVNDEVEVAGACSAVNRQYEELRGTLIDADLR
jgi:hypothetical protein